MAQHPKPQAERRRANRTALRLTATMRDGTRYRAQVRIIDMSLNGCRVNSPFAVVDDSWLWLSITGLETQYCRVVWHCEEFVGLEFEKPLTEAVFDRILQSEKQLSEGAIKELLNIATRTHWLARQASDSNIAILAELSRSCAEDAVVGGLQRSKPPKRRPAGD